VNYESPHTIKKILEQYGIALKKRWGQNFLLNRGAREKIVSLVDPRPDETIWEIGPGLGALTVLLLQTVKVLIVFEIDRGLIRVLEGEMPEDPRLIICQGDVLKTCPDIYKRFGLPDKICGNLPYNSASAIILWFIKRRVKSKHMVFAVQRELAQRMTARPGTKDYSSFSVLCQSWFDIKKKGELKPGSFYPKPDVFSSIVYLAPAHRLAGEKEMGLLFHLVRAGFSSRRKTLKKNILHCADLTEDKKKSVLAFLRTEWNVDTVRAEELSVDNFITLVKKVQT
jgi:16S rRNA (adenine1518-N6/adenine1519-N6)-dimethyltransferase